MNSALGKKKMYQGKEAEILGVSQCVSCAYISLVPPQMLFWAIDSSLDPVGKLKPLSWETKREEEHRIVLHNTVMDRPSPCSQHHRGRHPADALAHLRLGPRHQPESFSAVLLRLTTKKSSFLFKAVEPNTVGLVGWFHKTLLLLIGLFYLFFFNGSNHRWQPDRPDFCLDQSLRHGNKDLRWTVLNNEQTQKGAIKRGPSTLTASIWGGSFLLTNLLHRTTKWQCVKNCGRRSGVVCLEQLAVAIYTSKCF